MLKMLFIINPFKYSFIFEADSSLQNITKVKIGIRIKTIEFEIK
jgi:hypothetical protein